jgi:hypothetical protein
MTIDFKTIKFGTLAMLDVQKSKGRQDLERLVCRGERLTVVAEIEIHSLYESYDGVSQLFEGEIKSVHEKPEPKKKGKLK